MKTQSVRIVVVCLLLWMCAISGSAEEITIVGTGAGTAILKAVGEAFEQLNPGVSIVVPESIGSGGGIKAVGKDEYVIGRVARGIKESEQEYGLTMVPFAKIPIVFFVNTSVTVKELSIQQVLDMYSGKITNWSDVGGKDARIRVITREESDSSLSVLNSFFPGFKDITITPKSKTTFSDPETEEALQQYKGAIAYGTYANARNIDAHILTIESKSATDADYKYVGMLGLIFKQKNLTGTVKAFVDFATSDAAHDAIRSEGGTPY